MAQPTADIKVNPSREIIRLGPRAVRFLITGENSGGSIAILSWLSHVRSAWRLRPQPRPIRRDDLRRRSADLDLDCRQKTNRDALVLKDDERVFDILPEVFLDSLAPKNGNDSPVSPNIPRGFSRRLLGKPGATISFRTPRNPSLDRPGSGCPRSLVGSTSIA